VGGVLGGGSYAGKILTSGNIFLQQRRASDAERCHFGTGSLVKGTPVTNNTPISASAYVQTNAGSISPTPRFPTTSVPTDGMGGNWISGAPQATVFYYTYTGTNATCQFQCLDDVYTKCVKVEFTQVGPTSPRAAFTPSTLSVHNLGYDFETGGIIGTLANRFRPERLRCDADHPQHHWRL
jgi:hypothetical protein